MKTIYTARVAIANAPLSLERTFRFASERERTYFLEVPREGFKVLGFGIEHIQTFQEVMAEIQKELDNPL